VVDEARPVSEYDATFALVLPISTQGPVERGARSTLNCDSAVEVSVQVRLIWLMVAAVALRELGADSAPATADGGSNTRKSARRRS